MKEVLPGWLMVEVPEGARGFRIFKVPRFLEREELSFEITLANGKIAAQIEELPPGSYEIVGIVTEVSEEVAAGVVEKVDFKTVSGVILYHNYDALGIDFRDIVEAAFDTAKESLASLASSNGFEPDRTILLKKKV